MKELTLTITGPRTLTASHFAETIQELLLNLGYQVLADPNHGLVTPFHLRQKTELPAIRIVESFHEHKDRLLHA